MEQLMTSFTSKISPKGGCPLGFQKKLVEGTSCPYGYKRDSMPVSGCPHGFKNTGKLSGKGCPILGFKKQFVPGTKCPYGFHKDSYDVHDGKCAFGFKKPAVTQTKCPFGFKQILADGSKFLTATQNLSIQKEAVRMVSRALDLEKDVQWDSKSNLSPELNVLTAILQKQKPLMENAPEIFSLQVFLTSVLSELRKITFQAPNAHMDILENLVRTESALTDSKNLRTLKVNAHSVSRNELL